MADLDLDAENPDWRGFTDDPDIAIILAAVKEAGG